MCPDQGTCDSRASHTPIAHQNSIAAHMMYANRRARPGRVNTKQATTNTLSQLSSATTTLLNDSVMSLVTASVSRQRMMKPTNIGHIGLLDRRMALISVRNGVDTERAKSSTIAIGKPMRRTAVTQGRPGSAIAR